METSGKTQAHRRHNEETLMMLLSWRFLHWNLKDFWLGQFSFYWNLRMTFLCCCIGKTKHNTEGEGITSTTIKIERQLANTCQSAIFNLAHLKNFLSETYSKIIYIWSDVSSFEAYLSFLRTSAEYPHIIIQRWRTRVINFSVGIVREIDIIVNFA